MPCSRRLMHVGPCSLPSERPRVLRLQPGCDLMLGFPNRSTPQSRPQPLKRESLAQDEETTQGNWSDVGARCRASESDPVTAGTAGERQIHRVQSPSRSRCESQLSSCHLILWTGEPRFSGALHPEAAFPRTSVLRCHLNLQRHLAPACRPWVRSSADRSNVAFLKKSVGTCRQRR